MVLLFSLCFLNMTLFCLAMPKHRNQIFPSGFINFPLPNRMVYFFKPLAWVMLLVILNLCVEQYGWSIGPAVFFGVLSSCLLSLILLLTYRASLIVLVSMFLAVILLFNF